MKYNISSDISDDEIVRELHRLIRDERHSTVRIIVHLAEVQRRRIHLAAGCPSMYVYGTRNLGLSEHEAYHRILAARAAVRFPVVLEMLEAGRVSLTTVKLLAKHLDADNHRELLAAADGKTRREVEALVAARFPQPDVRTSVRRADVRPLAPARYHVSFTASGATIEKLRAAQDLLGHALPSGDVAEVIDRALTALLDKLAREKFGATDRPRTCRISLINGRDIPAAVRRTVAIRDGWQCAFIGKGGHRCEARRRLEFHHLVPFEVGGPPTVENIQLRCRAHNQYEADVFFAASRTGRATLAIGPATLPVGSASLPTRDGPSSPVQAS
jgi:hypothetical protein